MLSPILKTAQLLERVTLYMGLIGPMAYLNKVKAKCFSTCLENKE